jgi:hypothetical protein
MSGYEAPEDSTGSADFLITVGGTRTADGRRTTIGAAARVAIRTEGNSGTAPFSAKAWPTSCAAAFSRVKAAREAHRCANVGARCSMRQLVRDASSEASPCSKVNPRSAVSRQSANCLLLAS